MRACCDPCEPIMRRHLLVTELGITAGFGCAMVATLHPALQSVWTAHGAQSFNLSGHHRSVASSQTWMFALGITLTLTGLTALTDLLNRQRTRRPVPTIASTLATITSTLWITNLAFRLTTTVQIADHVSRGDAVPDWYQRSRPRPTEDS